MLTVDSHSPASLVDRGLSGLLAITFTTLKLCGVISWSWWWVLMPLWGPVLFVFIVAAITSYVRSRKGNK